MHIIMIELFIVIITKGSDQKWHIMQKHKRNIEKKALVLQYVTALVKLHNGICVISVYCTVLYVMYIQLVGCNLC